MNSIPVQLPEKDILARLKYNIHRTKLSSEDRKKINLLMEKGFRECEPSGVWLRLDIDSVSTEGVTLSDGHVLKSRSMSELLKESHSVFLMGATVGPGIVKLAAESMARQEGADALIFDAVGSETADAAMDWLNRYLMAEVKRGGEKLTKMRFSPGYGDLDLGNQPYFYEKLEMSKLGVTLSERYIFEPEKTVTAIVGVE